MFMCGEAHNHKGNLNSPKEAHVTAWWCVSGCTVHIKGEVILTWIVRNHWVMLLFYKRFMLYQWNDFIYGEFAVSKT